MKTNKILSAVVALSISAAMGAQTSFDAAKLYEEELNGTARYVGMGGAMSALGSDPSVISHNPAGIGTYRQSDINMSLSFFGTTVNTDPAYSPANQGKANGRSFYSSVNKSDLNMGFDNISVIFSGYESGGNYLNFGFAYRKLQNLDRTLDYHDSFLDADGCEVWRDYQDRQQNKTHSFDFNISCNLSDVVYFGVTLGLLSTRTNTDGFLDDFYAEGMHPDYPDGLYYTSFDMMNSSDGSGFNTSFGFIIRPFSALRLGAAVKTPTYYKQQLEYADYLYDYNGESQLNEYGEVEKVTRYVDYKFTSPWSLNLSAGLTLPTKTALGAEFEKHFTQRSSLSIGNTRMNNQGAIDFKDYSTVKLGLEQNIGNLSFRLGYNYAGSIFNSDSYKFLDDSEFNRGSYDENNNYLPGRLDMQIERLSNTRNFTCGLGYCSAPDRDGTQFYIDLAYVHGIRHTTFNLNEYKEDVDVNYSTKTDKLLVTFGWNF